MKNSLQLKYNLLHILYWLASCGINGYIAIFLKYKGLTGTEIGLVTGISCFTTIFLSPFVSSLTAKYKSLTIVRMLDLTFISMMLIFLAVSFLDLPKIIIMLLYISLIALIICDVPFLSTIAMNYIREGKSINFGLSRGMGSVSYAIAAVILGNLVDLFNPKVLSLVFVIAAVLFIILIHSLPVTEEVQQETATNGSIFTIIKKYPLLTLLLIGFSLLLGAATTLGTYLIHIVENLGGNTTAYGIAIFLMAASEMPVMMVVPKLLQRYSAIALIIFGSIAYVVRNVLICIAPNIYVVFAGMLFQSISYGLLTAVITYYVSQLVTKEDEVMGQTLISVMTSGFGAALGNLTGGILVDNFGLSAMFLFVEICSIVGCLVVISSGLMTRH